MANHRMFSNRIANSAKFLQMPTESQLLYFHMVQRADDDGVLEAYPLLKLLGFPADSFKLLVAKGYIKQLNEDQVIVITEWTEHNKIRPDRKINSIHQNLLKNICPDIFLVEARPRSDVEDNSRRIGGPSKDGLSKVKLSKEKEISEEISSSEKSTPLTQLADIDSFGNVISKKTKRNPVDVALIGRIKKRFIDRCASVIGLKPLMGIKSQKMIQYATQVVKMPEIEVYDLFEDWFTRTDKDDSQLQEISQALSTYNINRYRAMK